MTPQDVLRQFWHAPDACGAYGTGHINDSYRVTLAGQPYLLQRVSGQVFADPAGVMQNIQRVLAHFAAPGALRLPTLLPTRAGLAYALAEGEVWRLWEFLPGRCLDTLHNTGQAQAAGAAYGAFQARLASLPGPRWADPIAGFFRLHAYIEAYEAIRQEAQPWDALVADLLPLAERFAEPNRLIHGDCKVNNLLFDAQDNVCAVLDLDTVMWGHWAWDFGDLARSACARGEVFDLHFFDAVATGFAPFLPSSGAEAADADALVLAPCYVAGMLGVRFLTDHLAGDVYFKVAERGENLHRAATQFALLQSMRSQRADMLAVATRVLRMLR